MSTLAYVGSDGNHMRQYFCRTGTASRRAPIKSMTEQASQQTKARPFPRQIDGGDARSSTEIRPLRKKCAERTRREILRAAAWRFARAGYTSVTLKDIAADAGVTAALIVRYFGSKHELFQAIVRDSSPVRVDEVLIGPLDTLGRRLAESVVANWLTPELILSPIAALRSLDLEDAKVLLSTELECRFTSPLAAVLPGPNPHVRAKVIVAQMLAMLAFVLGALFEPDGGLAGDENLEEITRLHGLAFQACIDS